MLSTLKRLAARLPVRYQQELKRLHFARLIRTGRFLSAEDHDHEYGRLHEWVSAGDWVIDAGANVGNYSGRLSQLVGQGGRVFAFEPVAETFELLTANMARLPLRNVSLFNAAVSDQPGVQGMTVPVGDGELENRYMARLTPEAASDFTVMCVTVDSLQLPRPIRFIKIDVEGHELSALKGMRQLLERDRPVLVIEGRDDAVAGYLAALGYSFAEQGRSPNRVFTARG
jgi:FkbM family methyltransferase